MELGMIGLGRMGSNMVKRLLKAGHRLVVYDVNPQAAKELQALGAVAASSPEDLLAKMTAPRSVWMMVPAAIVDQTIGALLPHLRSGDALIDGGNSYYHDDIKRAGELKAKGVHYVDVGTSGGVWGLDRGYCLMIGGEPQIVSHLEPLFKSLAPGFASASRTAGRSGEQSSVEEGYLHCGPVGAGHFVKMVHNGIEYGLMAAYAEGMNILRHANVGHNEHAADAETTPLRHPERYQYDFDLAAISEVWRRGSVVASWLLDITAQALHAEPHLQTFAGRVSDSGEGRWTLQAAIDEAVPAPVLSAAVYARFSSRGESLFADKLLSAMRFGFGGHHEQPSATPAASPTPKQPGGRL